VLHKTTIYVRNMIEPLIPDGLRKVEDVLTSTELRITVVVATATAKSKVIGRGGENIHAIQHLAKERQHRDDPALKVRIDVVLSGGER